MSVKEQFLRLTDVRRAQEMRDGICHSGKSIKKD